MTTVFESKLPTDVPQAHALVIGVGDYPVKDGQKPKWDLKPLQSAPLSTLAFAAWLEQEFSLPAIGARPARPLGTIELLVSQAGGDAKYKDGAVERASMNNVRGAFKRWFARANSHEDNFAVLYFCGHGLQGDIHGLLLDGFTSDELDEYQHAIDIETFVDNMYRCKARQQVFLIDACRNAPPGLKGDRGERMLAPAWDPPTEEARDVAFIRATSEFSTAFGSKKDQPTRFTSALLKALRGAACEPVEGTWHVQTDRFVTHLNNLLSYESLREGIQEQRATGPGDHHGKGFTVHVPKTPKVPVFVRCEPECTAAFAVTRNAVPVGEPAKGSELVVELAIDEYDFAATLDDGNKREKRVWAKPTIGEVKL